MVVDFTIGDTLGYLRGWAVSLLLCLVPPTNAACESRIVVTVFEAFANDNTY